MLYCEYVALSTGFAHARRGALLLREAAVSLAVRECFETGSILIENAKNVTKLETLKCTQLKFLLQLGWLTYPALEIYSAICCTGGCSVAIDR